MTWDFNATEIQFITPIPNVYTDNADSSRTPKPNTKGQIVIFTVGRYTFVFDNISPN